MVPQIGLVPMHAARCALKLAARWSSRTPPSIAFGSSEMSQPVPLELLR